MVVHKDAVQQVQSFLCRVLLVLVIYQPAEIEPLLLAAELPLRHDLVLLDAKQLHDQLQLVRVILSLDQRVLLEDEVRQHAARGPDVDRVVVLLVAQQQLRRLVVARPHSRRLVPIRRQVRGQSPVDHQDVVPRHQDVAALDVPVHDASLMGLAQREEELVEVAFHLDMRVILQSDLMREGTRGVAPGVNERCFAVPADIVEQLHHVGHALEGEQHLYLFVDDLHSGVRDVFQHHLLLVGVAVPQEDFRKRPRAYFVHARVVGEVAVDEVLGVGDGNHALGPRLDGEGRVENEQKARKTQHQFIMGQASSQQSEKFLQEFNRECLKVKDMRDLRFGDVQIFRTPQNKLILVKTLWCNNEHEYNQCLHHCQKRSQLSHPNLIKLLGFHSNAQNQLCGDFSKFTVYLEYFDYTLEKSIEQRKLTYQYFQEAELWKILLTIIKLGVYLEEKNLHFGDIRPCNIQLEADIKIAEQGIIPKDLSGFQRAACNQEIAYLAPELLCFLNQPINSEPPQTFKSDAFSLGITLLEASSLISGRSFYKGIRLDSVALLNALEQVKLLGYSEIWRRMLKTLVTEQPEDRPSFQDIYEVLKGFEYEIMNLQPFEHLLQSNQYTQQPKIPPQAMQPPTQPPMQPPMQQGHHAQGQQSYYQQQAAQQQQYVQQSYYQHLPPMSSLPQQSAMPQQSSLPQQLPQQSSIPQQPQQLQGPQTQSLQPQYQGQMQPQQQVAYGQSQNPNMYKSAYPRTMPVFQTYPEEFQGQSPAMEPVYEQSPYHTLQSPQQVQIQSHVFQDQPDDGLSEVDRRIQNALKQTRQTEMRNMMTPNYY